MSAKLRESSAAGLLRTPGLQHDQAQAALAASFSVTAVSSPGALLDAASLPLFGIGELGVHEQAHALADQLTNGLCLSPERSQHRALLIDHALTHRAAHPWQIAVPRPGEVRARCAHQVARAVLAELRAGAPPDSARRAERLLRALPCGGCRRRAAD